MEIFFFVFYLKKTFEIDGFSKLKELVEDQEIEESMNPLRRWINGKEFCECFNGEIIIDLAGNFYYFILENLSYLERNSSLAMNFSFLIEPNLKEMIRLFCNWGETLNLTPGSVSID